MEIAAKKIIVALDDLNLSEVLALVDKVKPFAKTFKIGLSLFAAYGPAIVHTIKAQGVDIFLDLKLHDIPMQVAKAVEEAIKLSPRYLTVHASGGTAMLKEAAQAALGSETQLLAVSVLTSLSDDDFLALEHKNTIEQQVKTLTELALSAGIFGFISSPKEIALLRSQFADKAKLICPGVRPALSQTHDQSRIMTPRQAILAGADELVIGRPITKAPDAVAAAQEIHNEISAALAEKLAKERQQ